VSQVSRYIFRQLFWWTVFVTLCLTCVVWLTQSLRFVELIVNRGLSVSTFLYLTMLLLPTFIAMILPIALFAAVAFTYNKLTIDNELVVLRASGMSPLALARPALALAALSMIVAYSMTLFFIPASYRQFKEMQAHLRNSYSTVLLQEGVFNRIMKGVTVYVRSRTRDGELLGIIVHDQRNPEKPVTMMAERGALIAGHLGPRVEMFNGNRQEVNDKDSGLSLLYFDRYAFELAGLDETAFPRWRDPRERYLHELIYPSERRDEIWSFEKLRMEGHGRLAEPLLTFAFVLAGLAALLTGDFNRRGQIKRVVSAVIIVVVLEAAMLAVKSMGEKMPSITMLMYVTAILPVVLGAYVLIANPFRGRAAPRGTATA